MAYALDPARSLPEELRRVALERLDDAVERIVDAEVALPERVHEARKRTKEVRALLRLVRGSVDEGARVGENRAVRDAARRLADARDADVAARTLDALDGGSPELARLRDDLDARRRSVRAALAGGRVTATVAGELAEARGRIAEWSLPVEGWAAVGKGVRRSHRAGWRRYREAAAQPGDAALHEWRKRVKDHWYHLLLLGPAFPGPLDALAEEAHGLSDALGDDHDLARLAALVAAPEAPLTPRARSRLERRLGQRRAALQAQAWELGARLYGVKPKTWTAVLAGWWSAAGRRAPGS